MAQTTRDIKRRIRGINNTKQITKAMELVSSAKMRKSRLRLEKTRPYYYTVLESISSILAGAKINHPMLTRDESLDENRSLYIVVTSDRGLAGGYNANINRLVDYKFSKNKEAISLIVVGSKARDFFKNRGYRLVAEYLGISEKPEYSNAREISQVAVDLYISGQVDEINIVYTRFISTLSYEPRTLQLLPFNPVIDEKEDGSRKPMRLVEFEPSPEEALDYLIPKYIESTIFGALIEAASSEQAARMSAMKSATENADEMIDELNITYNRVRQGAITMELSEIVAGAEALK